MKISSSLKHLDEIRLYQEKEDLDETVKKIRNLGHKIEMNWKDGKCTFTVDDKSQHTFIESYREYGNVRAWLEDNFNYPVKNNNLNHPDISSQYKKFEDKFTIQLLNDENLKEKISNCITSSIGKCLKQLESSRDLELRNSIATNDFHSLGEYIFNTDDLMNVVKLELFVGYCGNIPLDYMDDFIKVIEISPFPKSSEHDFVVKFELNGISSELEFDKPSKEFPDYEKDYDLDY